MIDPIQGQFKIVQTMNPKGKNIIGDSKYLKDRIIVEKAYVVMFKLVVFFKTQQAIEGYKYVKWPN